MPAVHPRDLASVAINVTPKSAVGAGTDLITCVPK